MSSVRLTFFAVLEGGRQVQYQRGSVSLVKVWGGLIIPHAPIQANKYTRVRKSSFLLSSLNIITICISLLLISGASVQAADDFAQRAQEYKAAVDAATTAFNKSDYQSSIPHYSKAIGMSPFEVSLYFKRGIAFFKLGDTEKAKEDFDKAILLDSKMMPAFSYRGLCRMKAGDYKGALADYQVVLQANPKDATIHNNLSLLYASAADEKFRDKAKALEYALKAAELSKWKNAEILDTLATAYYINGRSQEATEAEKKAMALEPLNDEFKRNLSRMTEESGK